MTTTALAFPPLRPKQKPRVIASAQPATPALAIFPTIPPRYGVIAVDYASPMLRAGEVAVYDELWADEQLVEGAIYVTEYQRPTANMSWEMWASLSPRSRLDVRRSLIIARRWGKDPSKWMAHPLAPTGNGMALCSDGPFEDFQLAGQIIGKVVGIYNPAAID